MKATQIIAIGIIVYAVLNMQRRTVITPPPRPAGNLQNNYLAWLQYANLVAQQAAALYGSVQAAIEKLWGPGGPFYQTPVPEYDAGSIFWEDVTNIG